MHNLSSVYFVEHLHSFWAYLQPIVRRYTVWIPQLVLKFFLDGRLLSWLGETCSLYAFTNNSNDTKAKAHYIKYCKNPKKSYKRS